MQISKCQNSVINNTDKLAEFMDYSGKKRDYMNK